MENAAIESGHDTSRMNVVHPRAGRADKVATDAQVTSGQATTVPNRTPGQQDSHGEQPADTAIGDTARFAGVCDRCGQLYFQRHFPDRCLCRSCLLGGSKPAHVGVGRLTASPDPEAIGYASPRHATAAHLSARRGLRPARSAIGHARRPAPA